MLSGLVRKKSKRLICLFLASAPSQTLVPKETPATALQGPVARPGKALSRVSSLSEMGYMCRNQCVLSVTCSHASKYLGLSYLFVSKPVWVGWENLRSTFPNWLVHFHICCVSQKAQERHLFAHCLSVILPWVVSPVPWPCYPWLAASQLLYGCLLG